MAQLRSLKAAVADQIRAALEAADVLDVQVEPRRLWQPSPPVIDIYRADPAGDDEHAGMGDAQGATVLVVRARVLATDGDANQDLLDDFADPEHELSITAAILDDVTLGGWATDVDVSPASGDRLYETPDGKFYPGVEWQVTILHVPS